MNEADPPSAQDRRILVGVSVIALLIVGVAIWWEMERSSLIICKKSKPLMTATSLVSAVNIFQSEYGKLPVIVRRVTTDTHDGLKLLTILLGKEEKSDTAQNPKGIKFLDVMEGKNNKNGLIYSADGKSVEGLYDPWGSPYTVILDTENKEHLHFSLGSRTIDLPGRRAAAVSPGKDKIIGTADDVRTW